MTTQSFDKILAETITKDIENIQVLSPLGTFAVEEVSKVNCAQNMREWTKNVGGRKMFKRVVYKEKHLFKGVLGCEHIFDHHAIVTRNFGLVKRIVS